MTEPAQEQRAKTDGQYVCPECGRTFSRPAALGAHRRQAHGVAGTSRNASKQRGRRGRTAAARSTPARSQTTRTRRRRSTASPSPRVNRDALLQALFPGGIPARENVIRQLNTWLDEGERLARLA
jgi:hypothetical protein